MGERDGSDSPVNRARADTNALLPLEDNGQEVEELPKPKADLDKDAHDRVASPSTATSTPYLASVPITTSTSIRRLQLLENLHQNQSKVNSAIFSTFNPVKLEKHCHQTRELRLRHHKWHTDTQASQLQPIVN